MKIDWLLIKQKSLLFPSGWLSLNIRLESATRQACGTLLRGPRFMIMFRILIQQDNLVAALATGVDIRPAIGCSFVDNTT